MKVIEKNNINDHIKHIAIKLIENKSSAMVGAGYSYNSEKESDLVKDFSNWQQLGKCFFKSLYNREYKEEDGEIDTSILASKVEGKYGRIEVDKIIKEAIPDKGHKPGKLHKRLLELPWNNVYTTNYDTLLEDTINYIDRGYGVVYTKEDISTVSNQHRIFKLHGSYPSTKPWIITKEDYNNYPRKRDSFITDIKSSMQKDCFCLFGFSGTDPNFISWMEWTKKELREYSQPIYLIGIFDDGDFKKYEKSSYNIINMAKFDSVNNHEDGLTKFFKELNKHLSEEREKAQVEEPKASGISSIQSEIIDARVGLDTENNMATYSNQQSSMISDKIIKKVAKWELTNYNIDAFSKQEEARKKDRDKLTDLWAKERKLYPGWFIPPNSVRRNLYHYTNTESYLLKTDNIEVKEDMLEFAYELFWRYEIGMFEVEPYILEALKKLILSFEPLLVTSNLQTKTLKLQDKKQNVLDERVTDLWIYLSFVLLEKFRETRDNKNYNIIWKKLKTIKEALKKEDQVQMKYEEIMLCFYDLKLSKFKEKLLAWQIPDDLYIYRLRKAGLLVELGETNLVQEELKVLCDELEETSEKEVASAPNLVYLKTLLSCALYIYLTLIRANDMKNGIFEMSNLAREKSKKMEYFSQLYNIVAELKELGLDISNHLLRKNKKHPYDLDIETISLIKSENSYCRQAYEYIKIFEKFNCPLHINNIYMDKENLENAIHCLSNSNYSLSVFLMIRSGDNKSTEYLWTRGYVNRFNQDEVDEVSLYLINSINSNLNIIKSQKRWLEGNIYTDIAVTTPEMLSRLCLRCSEKVKIEIIDMIKSIYSLETISNFTNLKNLVIRLMKSLSDVSKAKFLPKLLEIEIPDFKSDYEKMQVLDPMSVFTYHSSSTNLFKDIKLSSEQKNKIFKNATNSNRLRERAISRLKTLYKLNLLDENEIISLYELVWADIDESTGLPVLQDYYCSIYLELPHPEEIDHKQRIKDYLLSINLLDKDDNSTAFTMGDNKILKEIIICSKENDRQDGIIWEVNEAKILIDEMINWWNKSKGKLSEKENSNFYSISDEYRARTKTVLDAVIAICRATNGEFSDYTREQLRNMALEMKDKDISCNSLLAVILKDDEIISLLGDIEESLYSLDKRNIMDAANAVWYLATKKSYISGVDRLVGVLSLLLRLRKQPSLNTFINTIHNILYSNNGVRSKEFYDNVCYGLDYLRLETDYNKDTIIPSLREKITIRKNAANLASMVYKHLSINGEEVPEQIFRWREICGNKEEFAEVRNQFRL